MTEGPLTEESEIEKSGFLGKSNKSSAADLTKALDERNRKRREKSKTPKGQTGVARAKF